MLDKKTLRIEARARREELTRSVPHFAHRIALFVDELGISPNSVIAGYWPVRDEADPRQLMEALAQRGATLALPRIEARDEALSFRLWRKEDRLVDNHHGIAEPGTEAELVVPDTMLVPLLAFDSDGHRLGYGGGYYDRTLDALRARGRVLAIGIAYAGQEVPQLPRAAHDHRIDMILTENGLRRFPASKHP